MIRRIGPSARLALLLGRAGPVFHREGANFIQAFVRPQIPLSLGIVERLPQNQTHKPFGLDHA